MKRKIIKNYIYLSVRKFLQYLRNYKRQEVKTILIYPKIRQEDRQDVINKVKWYLPKNDHKRVYMISEDDFIDDYILSIHPDDLKYLHFDLMLLGDQALLADPFVVKYFHKTEIIDKRNSQLEAGSWWMVFNYTFTAREKQRVRDISKRNFERFLEKNRHKKKAYAFGTGPSADKYADFEFDKNALKVICNSIVKNRDMMDHIGKPDILVFADPVFHFGDNKYAAQFREDMSRHAHEYDFFVGVPDFTMALLLHHFPGLEDKLIGISYSSNLNIPAPENPSVKATNNILTLLMLPMATAVADDIYMLGMDGRSPNETYFWQHSKKSQYNNLMQEVKNVHPYFFRDRDYAYYYHRHCKMIDVYFNFAEQHGKRFHSMMPSYIEAINARYAGQ